MSCMRVLALAASVLFMALAAGCSHPSAPPPVAAPPPATAAVSTPQGQVARSLTAQGLRNAARARGQMQQRQSNH